MRPKLILFLCPILLAAAADAQSSSAAKQLALEQTEELAGDIESMSMSLWDFSETALREERSADLLSKRLEQAGFEVERGVSGMPTAFVANWGKGKPIIGILAEYDALPGVGNAAAPERSARQDGVTSGHGCGHNLFGAASVGAAIAVKQMLATSDLPGTIRLYGTPAEETVVGKVFMAREGLFDDLDAAIDWHPGTETQTRNNPGRAMNSFEVEYFGQAAHAARDPWNGRSALDAVELLNYGVNMMREHIEPTTRIHYVIPAAGEAPNVVPEYARVWYYVRDLNRDSVQGYYDRIVKIAEGAALATGTSHQVSLITGVHECLMNRPLQEAMQVNLERIGGPTYNQKEQEFGRQLQAFLGIEEKGFDGEIQPLADTIQAPTGGSSDVCEVSHIVPAVGVRVTTAAADVPWHSWASTACHGMSAGVKGAQVAAKAMALTATDLLTNSGLLEAARADFAERRQGQPYHSPIPEQVELRLP